MAVALVDVVVAVVGGVVLRPKARFGDVGEVVGVDPAVVVGVSLWPAKTRDLTALAFSLTLGGLSSLVPATRASGEFSLSRGNSLGLGPKGSNPSCKIAV